MKIVIAGCGKIGTSLISNLVAEGHDVTAVDVDQQAITEVTNVFDVMTVCGDATDSEILKEAGVEGARLFIATTHSDEVNMLGSIIARKMGARHTVARIRNPKYSEQSLEFLSHQLELSLHVNPEQLTAHDIYNVLKFPSAEKIEKFASGDFEMIEIKITESSSLCNTKLYELKNKYKAKFLICAVMRDSDVYIPGGNFELKQGDRIGIVASRHEVYKLLKQLGALKKQAKSVMIIGCGTTSYYLAKRLIATGTEVKMVEKDPDVAKEFSKILPEATIICGDGAKPELLLEEGVRSVDAFVSLTGMGEQNILLSCFAQAQDVSKVITKINKTEFVSTAHRLGLESVVSSKSAVTDVVVRYARALQNSLGTKVEALYKLMDGKIEALEFNVTTDAEYTRVPLKELQLKNNILIAGILRKKRAIIPAGDDVIQIGDKIIIMASGHIITDLSDILK